jgi:hypothetical protein
MSRIYSSLEAAAEIGTTPRLLRRFIRQNDSWKNATYAGRYSFTESELKSLTKQFNQWASTKSRSTPRINEEAEQELTYLDEDKGITVEQMHLAAKNPHYRRQVLANRIERQRKLEARIAETRIRNNFTPQDA